MNDVPTLIVPDFDEERTLVDPRFARRAGARASAEPSVPSEAPARTPLFAPALHAARKVSPRKAFEGLVLVSLLLGLALVAHQQRQTADALRQAMQVMASANRVAVPQRPTELALAAESPGVAPISNETPRARSALDREALEQEAVSALASNDFDLALAKYQALARQFPGFPTYRDAAAILRAQLGCSHLPESDPGRCP